MLLQVITNIHREYKWIFRTFISNAYENINDWNMFFMCRVFPHVSHYFHKWAYSNRRNNSLLVYNAFEFDSYDVKYWSEKCLFFCSNNLMTYSRNSFCTCDTVFVLLCAFLNADENRCHCIAFRWNHPVFRTC